MQRDCAQEVGRQHMLLNSFVSIIRKEKRFLRFSGPVFKDYFFMFYSARIYITATSSLGGNINRSRLTLAGSSSELSL